MYGAAVHSLADRFTWLIDGLCKVIGADAHKRRMEGALAWAIWSRVRLLGERLIALAARVRAGRIPGSVPPTLTLSLKGEGTAAGRRTTRAARAAAGVWVGHAGAARDLAVRGGACFSAARSGDGGAGGAGAAGRAHPAAVVPSVGGECAGVSAPVRSCNGCGGIGGTACGGGAAGAVAVGWATGPAGDAARHAAAFAVPANSAGGYAATTAASSAARRIVLEWARVGVVLNGMEADARPYCYDIATTIH